MPTSDEAGFDIGKMPSPSDNCSSTNVTRATSPDQSSRGSSMVTLVSMDRARFVVEASSMLECKLLKAMVDGSSGAPAKEIPLPNMRGNVVAKVVEFCEHNRADPMNEIPKPIQYGKCVGDHVQEWYACFVGGLDDEMLFELLLAGNYLDLTPLLELCAATVGLRTMNKTPDEVRREFNIKEAFSPEVERKLREENKWSTEPPVGR